MTCIRHATVHAPAAGIITDSSDTSGVPYVVNPYIALTAERPPPIYSPREPVNDDDLS